MKVRSHKNAPGVLVGGWRADRTETFQPPSNLFPSLPLPHRHLIILLLVTRLPKALGFCRTCAQQCCSGRLTDSPGAISSSQTVAFCKAYHRGRCVILSSRLRSFPASFHLLVLSLTLLSDSFSIMNIPVFATPEASLHSLPWDLISPAVSANYYVPCPSDNANVSVAPV